MKLENLALFSHRKKSADTDTSKASGTGRKRRLCILGALFIIASVLTAAVLLPQQGYAVSLNGRVVGAVKSAGEAEEIIDSVQRQVSDILGYDYELDGEVELKAGSQGAADADLEKAIMDSVDEIAQAYILSVNGQMAAASTEEPVLRRAIEELSSRYSAVPGSSVMFDDQITISFGYAPRELIMDESEILAVIDPCGDSPAFPVTVRATVTESREETVAYETVYIDDPTVYEGTETVIQAGRDGKSIIQEQVTYINGVEQSRNELYSIVTEQPVSEQITRGTMYRPRYVSYGEYIWPAEGIITCNFGYRNIGIGSNNHRGLDIGGSYRSNILAADGGKVIFAENVYSYGNLVKIQHDNGDVTWYAHCDELIASVGDKVAQGDVIAYMGSTGDSTGVHLHFEVHRNDTAVDPLSVLP